GLLTKHCDFSRVSLLWLVPLLTSAPGAHLRLFGTVSPDPLPSTLDALPSIAKCLSHDCTIFDKESSMMRCTFALASTSSCSARNMRRWASVRQLAACKRHACTSFCSVSRSIWRCMISICLMLLPPIPLSDFFLSFQRQKTAVENHMPEQLGVDLLGCRIQHSHSLEVLNGLLAGDLRLTLERHGCTSWAAY